MVRNLEPQAIWNYFEDLNQVPRASKKEGRVVAWIMDFGKNLGLTTLCDDCVAPGLGNVVIKKPASKGMENRPPVIIQTHLDMVHQKNGNTLFDFDTQGIASYIDGEWVRAKGTTLGADNGMGVAAAMAVLSDKSLVHPAIEALFTIDEETGMTGAKYLDNNKLGLEGAILLNLDTEDDDELCIGCAGGIDTNVSWEYEETEAQGSAYTVVVKGLAGGHSGMDIILGRANANKLMNRLLYKTRELFGLRIVSIEGGGLRNAIPRESEAVVLVHQGDAFVKHVAALALDIKAEFKISDPGIQIEAVPCTSGSKAMALQAQDRLLAALYAVHNGVYRMHPSIEGLVETSSSLARVQVAQGKFMSQSLQRSSLYSAKMDLANAIRAPFEAIGAQVVQGGEYPGWEPLPNAPILHTMKDLYTELFGGAPHVRACHAGLECGIIGKHFPGLHMISFGPTIRGPHSPDEKVHIPSVAKFWRMLTHTLAHIPNL
ncbi:MAG: aminoacyl-histidine dipeptidase [Bacteroidetes bacterium]|jgi:dipeptidase D|nr:aminoacyl-histidine dipeptidase [Bacteroidota bacterium]